MENKSEDKSEIASNETQLVLKDEKDAGKISTSTSTRSLSTEGEDEWHGLQLAKRMEKLKNMSPGAVKLHSWLNQLLRITMTDGRVLIGMFFCTDRDANIILGACSEYLPEEVDADGVTVKEAEEPRILGLVMVPGKHIVNISVDQSDEAIRNWNSMNQPLSGEAASQDVM